MNLFRRHNKLDFTTTKEESVKRGLKSISSTLILLIAAPLLAFFITSHAFHSFEVDGSSMETTLQNGDRLIVNKLAKTIANISGSTYIPNRGDIIVLDRPQQLAVSKNVKHLIKRVVALPGERITVKSGIVTIYNEDNPNGFNPDKDKDYAKDITTTPGSVDVTIGQGEVFVLGDNRTGSTDSRIFGSISTKTIVGKATLRFIPIGSMRKL